MPRGDRSGPNGTGPMTGRGMGWCAGYPHPGYVAGRGMGCGGGRRWRCHAPVAHGWMAPYGASPYQATAAPADEQEALRREADALSRHLEQIQNRLNQLESDD